MGLLDALRARSRQVAPNLDSLFALPSAALTLETSCALVPSGSGAVCFKSSTGVPQRDARAEIDGLLREELDAADVTAVDDDLGFTWLVLTDDDLSSLVARLHSANSTLAEHGLGPHLLCAVVGFRPAPDTPDGGPCFLVYLFKRGTFYPFAPRADERRDNELELRVRADLADDLPMEPDLARWMALWGLPVG